MFPGSQKAFFSFFFTSAAESSRSIFDSCSRKRACYDWDASEENVHTQFFFTVRTSSEELILVPVSPGTIGFIRWERLAKPRVGKYWRHERLHLVHSFYEWFSLSVFYVRVIKVNTFQLLFQISKKVIHVLSTSSQLLLNWSSSFTRAEGCVWKMKE